MLRMFKLLLVLSPLFGAVLATFTGVPHAASQCSIRSDWNVYTVARGDNLYRISLRFYTTVTALVQGNCLSNPNLLYVGQQLRVPTVGGVPVPPYSPPPESSGYSARIGATQQAFEYGFMTWRADNGLIWVFLNGGQLRTFPLSTYGGLSGSTRYTVPAGRSLPGQGFKKVYDNFPDIRAALGWGIGSEQGFLMDYRVDATGILLISLADGSSAQIAPSGTWWGFNGNTPIPTPPPTPAPPPALWSTGATFQPFERGFMVWRADNGEIRVFWGSTATGATGNVAIYASTQYGALPTSPLYTRDVWYNPVSGFAKVWNFMPGVQDNVGRATGGEQGFTIILKQANGVVTSFTLPDGRSVAMSQGNGWTLYAAGQ